jgi:UrcA family protein
MEEREMSGLGNIFAIAAVAALGLSASVQAAPVGGDPDSVSVTVKLGDLDLGGQAGAVAAYYRIKTAAGSICGQAPSPVDLNGGQQYRQCMNATIDRAVQSLGNPIVAAYSHGASKASLASR